MTSRPAAASDTPDPGSTRTDRFGSRASRRRKVQLAGLALAAALLLA